VIGGVREAGFTIDLAAQAFAVMDGYLYGFALQQVNLPSHTLQESAELAENILLELPADVYPHLA
jgi:hypothetical protein